MITREVDFCNAATKEERNNSSDVKVNLPSSKTAVFSSSSTRPTTSSLSSWTRLKDPRIVRVSRAFGGKDRHSKVCTVRGLRDRRVRLSVPTAIQLYDLQERLGLSQPSKVVDWLLDVAKHDIDQLPPLQFPPRIFDPFLHPFPAPPPPSNAAPPTGSANERWDPLTHNGVIGSVQKAEEHYLHNFNNVVLSPSLPLQQYSFFHPTASASPPEFDLKNMINFQMLMSSSSQHAPPQSHSINHHSMVVKQMHFLHSHHEPDKNNNEEQ